MAKNYLFIASPFMEIAQINSHKVNSTHDHMHE